MIKTEQKSIYMNIYNFVYFIFVQYISYVNKQKRTKKQQIFWN